MIGVLLQVDDVAAVSRDERPHRRHDARLVGAGDEQDPGRGHGASSGVELGERRVGVLHEDGVQAGPPRAGDVAGRVVEEHGRGRDRPPPSSSRAWWKMAGFGLRMPTSELSTTTSNSSSTGTIARQRRRALAHVVGDEAEPVALGPQGADPVDDDVCTVISPEERPAAARSRPRRPRPCPARSTSTTQSAIAELAPLHLVPRVVGVLLVGADQQLEVAAAGRGQRTPTATT